MLKKGDVLFHKTFGRGIITDIHTSENSRDYIDVLFVTGNRKAIFQYPDSLGSFLFVSENDIGIDYFELIFMEGYSILLEQYKLNILKNINYEYINGFQSGTNSDLGEIASASSTAIKQEIKGRGISQLLHFTRFQNLLSIVNSGLVPVSSQDKCGIITMRNDYSRNDKKLHCTSVSIQFPNYKMLNTLFHVVQNTRWAILTLNPDLLFEKGRVNYYSCTNAAHGLKERNVDYAAFMTMFSEKAFCEGRTSSRELLHLPNNYTTDPQAEILVSDIIKPNYIMNINVCRSEDKVILEKLIPDKASIIEVNPHLFDKRHDFSFWQKARPDGLYN